MFEISSNLPKLMLDIFPVMVGIKFAWEIYVLNKQEKDQEFKSPSGKRYFYTERYSEHRA